MAAGFRQHRNELFANLRSELFQLRQRELLHVRRRTDTIKKMSHKFWLRFGLAT
jgi:hypothetical protein